MPTTFVTQLGVVRGGEGGIPMIVLKEGEITLFLYICRSICSTKIASNFRVFRIITSTKWTGGRE